LRICEASSFPYRSLRTRPFPPGDLSGYLFKREILVTQILAAPINDNDKFARSDCTWQRVLPAGIVLPFGGASAPSGFLLCDGTSYPTATYPDLFAAISYTYGGSGANFKVPDMRGRTAVGAGQGSGLTLRALGGTAGEETHALSIGELASHNHTINDPGHVHNMDHYHNWNAQGSHNHGDPGHAHGYNWLGGGSGIGSAAGYGVVGATTSAVGCGLQAAATPAGNTVYASQTNGPG
jgi:hypothetical protein